MMNGKRILYWTQSKNRVGERSDNPDVFQMLAYMTARRASVRILLYAAGEETLASLTQRLVRMVK
jgi:5-methylcytosine-specific restriction enzyme subunit McrC